LFFGILQKYHNVEKPFGNKESIDNKFTICRKDSCLIFLKRKKHQMADPRLGDLAVVSKPV